MVYRSVTNFVICLVFMGLCLLIFVKMGKDKGWKRYIALAAVVLFTIGGIMQFVPFSVTSLQSGTLMMRQPDLDRNVELESNGKRVMLDESQYEYMMELLSNVKMSVVFTPKSFRKASGAQGAYCLTFYHKVDKIDSIYLDMEDPGNSHYYCSQNDRKYQIEYESAEKLITYFNEVLGN